MVDLNIINSVAIGDDGSVYLAGGANATSGRGQVTCKTLNYRL